MAEIGLNCQSLAGKNCTLHKVHVCVAKRHVTINWHLSSNVILCVCVCVHCARCFIILLSFDSHACLQDRPCCLCHQFFQFDHQGAYAVDPGIGMAVINMFCLQMKVCMHRIATGKRTISVSITLHVLV